MKPNAQTWSNLSGFQRDLIVATLRRGGRPGSDPDDRPYGLGIKLETEILRDEKVNHGRLYPNFTHLADAGLVSIGERDKRTNTYAVTTKGIRAFREWLCHYAGVVVDPDTLASLPARAFDEQTSWERGTGEA